LKPLKILIVDDNEDYAEGMADLLQTRGHLSVVANSGQAALNKVRTENFDLTFMDVKMPGMNGIEAYKAILEINPQARVVMMTGYSVESLLEEAVQAGASGVLHKPLNMDEVFKLLESLNDGIILMVDDDPDFTQAVSELLEASGYRVEAASTGTAAIKRIIDNHVNLLLIDLRLPELDGLEVIRRLDDLGLQVPTVLLTGFMREESERLENFTSPSLSAVLTKPILPDELIKLVHSIRVKQ